MSIGVLIWTTALIGLLFYILHITWQQPKGFKFPLFTYWLLFILTPEIAFAFKISFKVAALMPGFVLLVLLALIGEHGLRLWARLVWRSK